MNITRRHNQKRRRSAQKRAAEETTRRLRALYGPERRFVRHDVNTSVAWVGGNGWEGSVPYCDARHPRIVTVSRSAR